MVLQTVVIFVVFTLGFFFFFFVCACVCLRGQVQYWRPVVPPLVVHLAHPVLAMCSGPVLALIDLNEVGNPLFWGLVWGLFFWGLVMVSVRGAMGIRMGFWRFFSWSVDSFISFSCNNIGICDFHDKKFTFT